MCQDVPVRNTPQRHTTTRRPVFPFDHTHNLTIPPQNHNAHRGHVNERLCLPSALALYGGGVQRQRYEHVVSGSEDGRLCVWDLQSKQPLQRLAGHADAVLALAKHPTEALLATGGTSGDCVIRLWRIPELAPSFAEGPVDEGEEERQEQGQGQGNAVEGGEGEPGEAMDQSA